MTEISDGVVTCLPLLVFVSGKPGSGKSTLARRLADYLWLPLLSNDAIRHGLLETWLGARDPAAQRVDGPTSVRVFYATTRFMLSQAVSLVVEFSFRRGLSEPDLRPLTTIARLVNVHCDVPVELAQRRFIERESTERRRFVEDLRGHRPVETIRYNGKKMIDQMQHGTFDWTVFDPPDLDVPRLRVDTSAGYAPDLDQIVAFVLATSSSRHPGS